MGACGAIGVFEAEDGAAGGRVGDEEEVLGDAFGEGAFARSGFGCPSRGREAVSASALRDATCLLFASPADGLSEAAAFDDAEDPTFSPVPGDCALEEKRTSAFASVGGAV